MWRVYCEVVDQLYKECNKDWVNCLEIYVDLYGLYFEEVVEYLEKVFMENIFEVRLIYVIMGIGYYSKNGKDKVGKVVWSFLNEWWYVYWEFFVLGDCNSMGGILGIDVWSWDWSFFKDGVMYVKKDGGGGEGGEKEDVDIFLQGVEIGEGKVKFFVRDMLVVKELFKGLVRR